MSERSVEEIRQAIASERRGLADDLDALHDQARSLLPLIVAGSVALVLLSRGKCLKPCLKLVWKLC